MSFAKKFHYEVFEPAMQQKLNDGSISCHDESLLIDLFCKNPEFFNVLIVKDDSRGKKQNIKNSMFMLQKDGGDERAFAY